MPRLWKSSNTRPGCVSSSNNKAEIDGKRYDLVLATGACEHGDFLFAHTPYWKKIAPTRRPE
jgi:hypothetical protein